MKKQILQALKEVLDPETRLNLVDMGLIYDIRIKEGKATIVMSLTTPFCPYGVILKSLVRDQVEKVKGVKEVFIELTFTPAWNPDRISKEGRLQLGW